MSKLHAAIIAEEPVLSKCYSGGVIRASQVMPGVLAEVIRKAPLTPDKVAFAWRFAVGPALDKATRVALDDAGTLQVTADSAAWIAAIRKSSPMIKARLESFLGAGVVRNFKFKDVRHA